MRAASYQPPPDTSLWLAPVALHANRPPNPPNFFRPRSHAVVCTFVLIGACSAAIGAVASTHDSRLPCEAPPMASPGSVTHWIDLLKTGDAAATQHIWDRFFSRLVGLAQAQLRGLSCGLADGEDVALGAFNRFCLAARRGRFPRLEDRDDLWRLLTLLAERKARDLRRRQGRQKRCGGQVHDEAWLTGRSDAASGGGDWPALPRKSPPLNSPPSWRRNAAPCSGVSTMTACARSPSPRWRATRTRNWPPRWVAASAPSSASSS